MDRSSSQLEDKILHPDSVDLTREQLLVQGIERDDINAIRNRAKVYSDSVMNWEKQLFDLAVPGITALAINCIPGVFTHQGFNQAHQAGISISADSMNYPKIR